MAINRQPSKREQEEIIKKRKIRNAGYVLEDFQDAKSKIGIVGPMIIALGFILLVSTLVFKAHNSIHAIVSFLVGITIILFHKKINWTDKQIIVFVIVGFLATILLELLFFGFPESIIPNFGVVGDKKMVNLVTLINDATPLIYYAVKLALLFPFISVLLHRNKIDNIEPVIKEKLNIRF